MNPVQSRFTSVEALKDSNVDVRALKAHGRIEVNGKHYEIRAAADGQISVLRPDKQAAVDKFFKSASHLLGGQSQSSRIAQTLNEKAAEAQPQVTRQLAGRLNLRQINLEQGQSSSATSRVAIKDGEIPDGKKTFASLLTWAKKAQKLKQPMRETIYELFKNDAPKTKPMAPDAQKAYMAGLKKLERTDGIELYPQGLDGMSKQYRLLGVYMDQHPRAGKDFYRIVPEPARRQAEGEDEGRLTIGVEPRYAGELAKAMTTLIKSENSILSGKIAGPEIFGQRTDSAILYVRSDYAGTQELGRKLKSMLPAQAFIDHTPASMQSAGKGLAYAETVQGDSTSHGLSRADIITTALSDRSSGSLEKKLKTTLAAKGYNPDNPAFRLTPAQ
ncbi:T3SS effector HopA1 family protein [Pseudomonas cucumis]|uniref:T3SS effector HopA1 family protein n=1 Tax=Pseudomonas cucumis TaxID=2954082 RepID=A0ABY9ENY6_9PSED|nr:T3SS effector HopA1 family protein [Pseudomonas cucumis]WLG82425.1 T3SS effector HopA1 family protein [Pseudomonas cucumis]